MKNLLLAHTCCFLMRRHQRRYTNTNFGSNGRKATKRKAKVKPKANDRDRIYSFIVL